MLFVLPAAAMRFDDAARAHVARLRRAIELAGLTEQQACAEMDLTQTQWAAQCRGEGHISYTRLAQVPTALAWLALLTAEEYGLPAEVRRSTRLALALVGRRRMARMGATQKESRTA